MLRRGMNQINIKGDLEERKRLLRVGDGRLHVRGFLSGAIGIKLYALLSRSPDPASEYLVEISPRSKH